MTQAYPREQWLANLRTAFSQVEDTYLGVCVHTAPQRRIIVGMAETRGVLICEHRATPAAVDWFRHVADLCVEVFHERWEILSWHKFAGTYAFETWGRDMVQVLAQLVPDASIVNRVEKMLETTDPGIWGVSAAIERRLALERGEGPTFDNPWNHPALKRDAELTEVSIQSLGGMTQKELERSRRAHVDDRLL